MRLVRTNTRASNVNWIVAAFCAVLSVAPDVHVSAQVDGIGQPGTISRENLPTQWAVDYDFNDVDVDTIERWLAVARIRSPVQLAGKIFGWVWMQPSSRSWFALSDYRVEGQIRSPLFEIDTWRIREAQIRFGFQDGKWYVGSATGSILNANLSRDSVLGKVDLQAVVPMSGDSKAELNGSLNQVSLRDLVTTVGLQEFPVTGEGQLKLNASAAVRDLGHPNRWTAIGTIQTNGVTLDGLPTIGVVADWRLDQGLIEVKELLVSRFDHRLGVKASIELTRPWNWWVPMA